LFLKSKEKENPFILTRFREIFLTFIHYEEEIDLTEKQLMEKIVEFGRKKVSQVMIPISQVKALPIEAKVKDALEFSKKYGFSYIPLYEGEISRIKLLVRIKDLIGKPLLSPNIPLSEFGRKPLFVPEVVPAHEVLSLLQETRNNLAIVVDEYGYSTGLVTVEDLVEEVLGEFRDTLDYYVPEYKRIGEKTFLCKAHIEIEKLQSLGLPVPSGDYETLAGFIYSITNRIPSQGEVITYKNLEMKITKAKPNGIEEVLIKVK
jgi:CBS domain containing-hemolysin-like protein